MKMIKALFLLILIIPSLAWSSGNSGKGDIDYLYQRSSDGLLGVFKKNGNWSNPDDCDSSERIVLKRSNEFSAEFYSAILASKMSQSEFQAFLLGCVDWNGTTYPVIFGVYTY